MKGRLNLLEQYTALYSPLDMEYNQAMSGKYENLSCCHDNGIMIASLHRYNNVNMITGFWRPVICFGSDKFQREHIERLYEIGSDIYVNPPDIYYQDYLIDGSLSPISRFLLDKGYKVIPYYTQIIDLTKSVEELHSDLRKSYKSLVNKHKVYNCSIKPLKTLHLELKGITRPDKTWDIQERMILANQAFCLASGTITQLTMNPDAAILVYYNEHCAYYASASAKIDSHHLIWAAILKAKKLGCKMFEMGEQNFSGDEKLVNISHFKVGFGGRAKIRLDLRKD